MQYFLFMAAAFASLVRMLAASVHSLALGTFSSHSFQSYLFSLFCTLSCWRAKPSFPLRSPLPTQLSHLATSFRSVQVRPLNLLCCLSLPVRDESKPRSL